MMTQTRSVRIGLVLAALLAVVLALAAILLLACPIRAQGPVRPAHSDPSWHAAYWNNMELVGSPVLEREEATLDYDWGGGSPDSSVPADQFSARWRRYVDVGPGVYRFRVSADDGVRFFVDGDLLVDRWSDHGVETHVVDVDLAAGHHLLQMEYYEHEGAAVARLSWARVSQGTTGSGPWRGEYYRNRDLYGSPALIRYSEGIDWDWGGGSPAPGALDGDDFSVRWTRTLHFSAGSYRFAVTSDDGARLWVNNHLLIDAWHDQAATTHVGKIYLPAGDIPMRLEYYEHKGEARIKLAWNPADQDWDWRDEPCEGRWYGEYFNSRDLSGSVAWTCHHSRLDFDWGIDSPAPGIVHSDDFSARWTRSAHFDEGTYRFVVECDDGVRLYVDDRLIMDEWHDMSRTRMTRDLHVDKGYHTVRLEYYEHQGVASIMLAWEREKERARYIGNIITCVPPQPENYAWIKLYRLDGNNNWESLGPGMGSIEPNGFLKIDGLPVDVRRFGSAGEPYRVEQWIDGRLANSTGNFQAGEPVFLVRPYADNYTPWPCS